MNHVGNLLKSIIVRGSVPAWATIVTAADCQIMSEIRCLKMNLKIKIPVKADNKDDSRIGKKESCIEYHRWPYKNKNKC